MIYIYIGMKSEDMHHTYDIYIYRYVYLITLIESTVGMSCECLKTLETTVIHLYRGGYFYW
jgi:hypothetical protein